MLSPTSAPSFICGYLKSKLCRLFLNAWRQSHPVRTFSRSTPALQHGRQHQDLGKAGAGTILRVAVGEQSQVYFHQRTLIGTTGVLSRRGFSHSLVNKPIYSAFWG